MKGHALVFDSGLGGLSIVSALRAAAPHLAIDYAADNGFFPYGDKSDEELKARLPWLLARCFAKRTPDIVVIACNTASTLALEDIRAALPCPVIGVVPAVRPAAMMTKTGVIGLLATPATVRREYTDRLVSEFAPGARVIRHGSTELVRLAEAHLKGETPPPEAFAKVQAPLFSAPGGAEIDVVVLACTHFPLVKDQLAAAAPRPLSYIDSGEAVARQALKRLTECGAKSASSGGAALLTGPAGALARPLARAGFQALAPVF